MSIHHLKIQRQPYEDLVSGRKTAEVRSCADREFREGDRVELFLIDETGNPANKSIVRTITHIQRGYGLPDDICVLSYGAVLAQEALHPIQKVLRANGELIALQATVSQQAQMIEYFKGAPVVERQESVPKHKFDTLVQHCKRLDAEIAQARAHVNEITLYQQNAVWFWQHDGEDYLQSLSCPIIIQPHHLRELLEGKAKHNPIAEPPAPVAVRITLQQVLKAYEYAESHPHKYLRGTTNWCAAVAHELLACLDKVKELNQ